MIVVAHRVNTPTQLKQVPREYGVEFDVREGPDGVVVTHDPWTESVPLDIFLDSYNHAFAIVNIKSEGIEPEVLRMLQSYAICDFFLLDCSFPMLIRLNRRGEHRTAVRLSEYESIETVKSLRGKVNWVWIDTFTKLPVTPEDCQMLHSWGFDLCLVSPELQGYEADYSRIFPYIDMICTKHYLRYSSAGQYKISATCSSDREFNSGDTDSQ